MITALLVFNAVTTAIHVQVPHHAKNVIRHICSLKDIVYAKKAYMITVLFVLIAAVIVQLALVLHYAPNVIRITRLLRDTVYATKEHTITALFVFLVAISAWSVRANHARNAIPHTHS